MSLRAHITASCGSSLFGVYLRYVSVLRWKNSSMCSSLTAPHGGITLAKRISGSQHHIVSNSYKVVRAPRRLRSHWPPHRSATAQRPQAPCPAHSYHTVPPAHKFRRAPLEMSQAMQCQLRSLKPPRSSHFIATFYSPSSTSRTSGRHVCTTAPRARLHSAPPPPPGLEDQAHLSSSHGIPVKAAPVRPRTHTSTSVPSLQPHVSITQVGTHRDRSSATYKRSASTARAGTHHAIGADPRARRGPFPKIRALVLSMVKFGHSQT